MIRPGRRNAVRIRQRRRVLVSWLLVVPLAIAVLPPAALGQSEGGLAYRPPDPGLTVKMDNGFRFEVVRNNGRHTLMRFRTESNPKHAQKHLLDRVLTTLRSDPDVGVVYYFEYDRNPASLLWPLRVGKKVSVSYLMKKGQKLYARGRATYHVARKEWLRLRGKNHFTYVVVRTTRLRFPDGRQRQLRATVWYSPDIRFFVRRKHSRRTEGRFVTSREFQAIEITRR
jgi:hypothetical protein